MHIKGICFSLSIHAYTRIWHRRILSANIEIVPSACKKKRNPPSPSRGLIAVTVPWIPQLLHNKTTSQSCRVLVFNAYKEYAHNRKSDVTEMNMNEQSA